VTYGRFGKYIYIYIYIAPCACTWMLGHIRGAWGTEVPIGPFGPLGPYGPSWAHRALWALLGPVGPLGPYGPFGLLGPFWALWAQMGPMGLLGSWAHRAFWAHGPFGPNGLLALWAPLEHGAPRAAPPAYLRFRARRWWVGAVHFNLVHVPGWLVVALLPLAFGLSVLAASQPLWLMACCLAIALLLATFGHSVWVVCQSPGLLTFTMVLVPAAAPGEERTHLFSVCCVRSCLDCLPHAPHGFWVFDLSSCG